MRGRSGWRGSTRLIGKLRSRVRREVRRGGFHSIPNSEQSYERRVVNERLAREGRKRKMHFLNRLRMGIVAEENRWTLGTTAQSNQSDED